ncbi:MAG: metabolite traffic protein EboE [Pseudomonadota bacterium]
MKLDGGLGHLTYCLNIHPAQTWDEVKAALSGPVRAVKDQVSPDAPFDVGLRLSAEATDSLQNQAARDELADIFRENDFRALSMNGFPYGPFHGQTVKAEVYQPDWRTRERVDYTNALSAIMVELAQPGETVSLSTVPGTFKPLGAGAEAAMAANMIECVAECVRLKQETDTTVAIAIEPEPYCFLETIAETVDYFRDHLFSDGAVAQLAELGGLSKGEAAAALPAHLGLCYDVCHAAVEYEDPAGSIADLRGAGIPVHKIQLSAALRVAEVTPDAREALKAFDEPTYLHQVISRSASGLRYLPDLPEALARGTDADGEEWRIHFHVPIFVEEIERLGTTQGFLREILRLHKEDPISDHLEVETYTWDVLPPDLTALSMEDAVARELNWVMGQLG